MKALSQKKVKYNTNSQIPRQTDRHREINMNSLHTRIAYYGNLEEQSTAVQYTRNDQSFTKISRFPNWNIGWWWRWWWRRCCCFSQHKNNDCVRCNVSAIPPSRPIVFSCHNFVASWYDGSFYLPDSLNIIRMERICIHVFVCV